MKIYISLALSLFFFISLFIFAYVVPLTPPSASAFQHHSIGSNNNFITDELLLRYYSTNSQISSQAKHQIAKTALADLNYSHWGEFANSIKIHIYKEQILPSNSKQLIVALNLSKDLAVIAVFEKKRNNYVLHSKIENLVPIKDIHFYTYPSRNYKFMSITQMLDERLGAFSFEEFLEIYFLQNESFEKVWRKPLYSEEIFKEVWIEPEASENVWNKIVEKTLVDIVSNESITINTFSSLSKYIAYNENFPSDIDFKLVGSSVSKQSYKWNNQQQSFLMISDI
ncbi:MAG: hypothetical protein COA82_01390 [Alkaliphilus sp.]|nr:hypothetical protein [Alkaliphilus sp. AH-315-G20]MBN4069492.1 hypothetical protein [bacterium AH-315-G05]PHS36263.1 MAG: hypothetical protein COA82_01390 [Alkaliphilus sp.]